MAKERKETPVPQLQQARRAKLRSPTGRRVLRDSWLAPLTLDDTILAQDAQPNASGLRASDKGFLNIGWREYIEL